MDFKITSTASEIIMNTVPNITISTFAISNGDIGHIVNMGPIFNNDDTPALTNTDYEITIIDTSNITNMHLKNQ